MRWRSVGFGARHQVSSVTIPRVPNECAAGLSQGEIPSPQAPPLLSYSHGAGSADVSSAKQLAADAEAAGIK